MDDVAKYFNGLNSVKQINFVNDFIAREHGNALTLELMNAHYLSKNRTGVLMFYSPTCTHCHKVAPTFAEVAKKLQDQLFFGTVNCFDYVHKNNILSDFLQIEGVPAIKFVRGNKFVDYTGGKELKVLLANICKQYGICNLLPDVAEYREPGALKYTPSPSAEMTTGGKRKKKLLRKKKSVKKSAKSVRAKKVGGKKRRGGKKRNKKC